MVTLNQYSKASNIFLNELYEMLNQHLFNNIETDENTKVGIRAELASIVLDDVCALITNDPAARPFSSEYYSEKHDYDFIYVWKAYKGLRAVVSYRVAHYIYYYCDTNYAKRDYNDLEALERHLKTVARKLSEETKIHTAVEIHPAAHIGKRFVIDHGYGTVIGETTVIGDDCYILQGVVLGAAGVKDNASNRRHPKIGNNVEIAGGVRIFGPITIGDKTKIYGYAIVNHDIPPASTIKIVNQLQIVSPPLTPRTIYGARPLGHCLEVFGKNLSCCKSVEMLNDKDEILGKFQIEFETRDSTMQLKFPQIGSILEDSHINEFALSFIYEKGNIILRNSQAWRDYVKFLKVVSYEK